MSYYYDYYIGYKKDGKLYPWGIYDAEGKIHPVLSRSRSFASDLHETFINVSPAMVSDKLRSDFGSTDWNGEKVVDVRYLPVDDLPRGSYIKTGYFLIKDVNAYEQDYDWFEGFGRPLSPQIYAVLLDKELKFGKNQPQKDDEGFEYTEPNASDYMFYCYPDYDCKEYEVFLLRETLEAMWSHKLKDVDWVILETEG